MGVPVDVVVPDVGVGVRTLPRRVARLSGGPSRRKALTVGILTTLVVGGLCQALPPPAPAIVGLFCIAAVPSAPDLARRIAINLVAVVAWLPVTMWLPPSLLGATRAPAVVALLVGSLVLWRLAPGSKARLRPRVTLSDLTSLTAGVVAGVAAWPFACDRSPEALLSVLLRGWDNAGHFFMYYLQRSSGVASPLGVRPADGSRWDFTNYVQWPHSSMAFVAEAVWGAAPGSALVELDRYAHLQWGIYVASACLVSTTTLASLRAVHRARRALAVPIATGVAVTAVPGARLLFLGHSTFLLVAVSVASSLVLACCERSKARATFVCVSGAVVSLSWVLLTPAIGLLAALKSLDVLRNGTRAARAWVVLGAAAALGLAARVAWLDRHASPAITAEGESTRPHPLVPILLLGTLVLLSHLDAKRGVHTERGRYFLLTAVVSCVELSALAGYQLASVGQVSYYWWKLATGISLFALIACVVQLCRHLDESGARRGPVWVRSTAVLAAGTLGWGLLDLDIPAPAIVYGLSLPSALTDRDRQVDAAQLVALLEQPPCGLPPSATTMYLPTRDDRSGANLDQWYHALTLTRTARVSDALAAVQGQAAASPWMSASNTWVVSSRSPRTQGSGPSCVIVPSDAPRSWLDAPTTP
ncbi:hypothetical protein GCM10027517_02440 [Phycicoccus ginsengisoli]